MTINSLRTKAIHLNMVSFSLRNIISGLFFYIGQEHAQNIHIHPVTLYFQNKEKIECTGQ